MKFLPLQLQLIPEQASSFALEIDLFYLALWILTIVFTIGVAVAAAYLMIRYRRKSDADLPEHIHGALALEITWTVIPFIISMGIFVWGAKLYYELYTEPKDALEIFVTGKQWMWRAQHPDGVREINALHVPVGRPVKLTMTSEDVLHAYFIPAFRTKTDVVPGRYTTTWFKPTKAGVYHLFCAEYCGTQHSGMIGSVYAMEPADFQAWLAGGGGDTSGMSPVEGGKKLFNGLGCATCHKDDNSGRGPTLLNVYGTSQKLSDGSSVIVDDAYIRESILHPRSKTIAGYPQIMSTYQGQVTEEQVMQLIAFIKSIGPAEKPGAPAAQSALPAALSNAGTTPGTGVAQPAATPKPAPPAPKPAKQ